MSKLKTLSSLYLTNIQTQNVPSSQESPYHSPKAKISRKKYNHYNVIPPVITDNKDYMWNTGRNKMYTRYVKVKRLDLENPVMIPNARHKQVDRDLKMSDFLYDDITNAELKLIRNRFKKGAINLKGFVFTTKSYVNATSSKTHIHITWLLNDKYVVANVHDFVTLLRLKLL